MSPPSSRRSGSPNEDARVCGDGLEPADYERGGVVGFGDYLGRASSRYAAHLTDAERRKPLPYLFTG